MNLNYNGTREEKGCPMSEPTEDQLSNCAANAADENREPGEGGSEPVRAHKAPAWEGVPLSGNPADDGGGSAFAAVPPNHDHQTMDRRAMTGKEGGSRA